MMSNQIAAVAQSVREFEAAKAAAKLADDALAACKATLLETAFPAPYEGTQRFEIAPGLVVKGAFHSQYKLAKGDALDYALAAMPPAVADELVTWEPKLNADAYRKLPCAYRELINIALTVSKRAPTITIERAEP